MRDAETQDGFKIALSFMINEVSPEVDQKMDMNLLIVIVSAKHKERPQCDDVTHRVFILFPFLNCLSDTDLFW